MIEIIDLTKRFKSVIAIQSLSLFIPSSTIFGYVGPNGAGKTTTLNIMSGIFRPTSGIVKILGAEMELNSIKLKKQIGVVPEGMALFEGLTGEEQLTFAGKVYELPTSLLEGRIEEILNLFEIYEAKSRLIESYSQGMKKKLAFASAIMHSPKVLFLDEPFENVDPLSRKVMKDILITMRNNGATIFFTSHNLETVETFCDEVAIINKGKLVFQSKTEEIRNKIKNALTQETYQSLEEIFIDIVTDRREIKAEGKLSWL
jgi:ABC-2 type transport system ATP-binding protein